MIGLDKDTVERDLWERAEGFGDIWDIHIPRRDGSSTGIAKFTFDRWNEAERFKQMVRSWNGRGVKVVWDRDWTMLQGGKGRPGEYPMDLDDRERRTLMIGGIMEGGGEEEEAEWSLQEEIIRRATDAKRLSTWRQIKWKIEKMRRWGRKRVGKSRIIEVCFATKQGADKVYHSRNTADRDQVWVRRYRPRITQEMDRMAKETAMRRWQMSQRKKTLQQHDYTRQRKRERKHVEHKR